MNVYHIMVHHGISWASFHKDSSCFPCMCLFSLCVSDHASRVTALRALQRVDDILDAPAAAGLLGD